MRQKGKSKRLDRVIRSLAMLVTVVLAGVSPAAGVSGTAAQFPSRAEQVRHHNADVQQVLSVIEHRTRGGKVLEKMQEKLFTLGDRELHLAALLCERIARDDHSAGANIAFSIVTAMIVLS